MVSIGQVKAKEGGNRTREYKPKVLNLRKQTPGGGSRGIVRNHLTLTYRKRGGGGGPRQIKGEKEITIRIRALRQILTFTRGLRGRGSFGGELQLWGEERKRAQRQ